MLTALNILISLLLPSLVALIATLISIQAVRRHITVRQLTITALIVVASVSSISVLYKAVYLSQAAPALPFVLILLTLAISVAQFATAALFGAVNKLRRKLA